jgi:hypothetical protein
LLLFKINIFVADFREARVAAKEKQEQLELQKAEEALILQRAAREEKARQKVIKTQVRSSYDPVRPQCITQHAALFSKILT